jgi:hypothetical protein
MTVMVGRLVSDPKMIAVVDLRPGSREEVRQFSLDLLLAFGITEIPSAVLPPLPPLLSPEELREQNILAGQRLHLNQE